MSTDSSTAAAKKRASATSPKRTSEDDHRRKRRNRPTQSCLNCHTSKRMCDRQRPCGRCTQLGLTGLCVYEVDNPSHRANAQDEAARLQKRVAELESIIRELKNKPHPRWAQSGATPAGGSSPGSLLADESGAATSSSSGAHSPGYFAMQPKSPGRTRERTPASPSAALEAPSGPSSGPSVFAPPSPLNTPSPAAHSPTDPTFCHGADITSMLTPDYDLSSLLTSCHTSTPGGAPDGYFNDMIESLLTTTNPCSGGHGAGDHCGCLNDHTSYSTVLELSLRLRRAVEVLSRYAKHGAQSDCKVHRGITELDRFTTTALGNIVSPPEPISSQPRTPPLPAPGAFGRPAYAGERHPQNGAPATLAPGALQSPRAWDFKSYPSPPWDDSFMSWEPLRQPSEWPQGAGL
ncbi:hypothetical protein C8Q77DRAFT_1160618 [Trametes polyzona]|nr:hypothetical protein C8Q77DRAFT_1160618 [Trametes polyzona]